MELSDRDQEVVRLAGLFGQVDSSHVARTVFRGLSGTTIDRCLQRLTKSSHLVAIGRRAARPKGGATPYVYELGSMGMRLLEREGRHRKHEPDKHKLAVTDTYVHMVDSQRLHGFEIEGFAVEFPVGSGFADLAVRLAASSHRYRFYLEVDRATESPQRVQAKLDAYIDAFEHSAEGWFPAVVFVVANEWHPYKRRDQIAKLIAKLPEDTRDLFRVCVLAELIPTLLH